MYQQNKLREPGGITLAGTPIDLRKVKTPAYFLSTREDHIAPWKTTYLGTGLLKGPIRFVLAASGHIAGVVNPPEGGKYSHWINPDIAATPDEWLEGATEIAGSWWPDWQRWVTAQGGAAGKALVAARIPADGIEAAPGRYVAIKALD
jgi:polyhydroxyalkanoate synthase